VTELDRANLTDKMAIKCLPYIKYLSQKSGYKRGKIKVSEDMPDNYIDYLIIDIEALRIGELNMFNYGDCFTFEITVLNYDYEVGLQYEFLISPELQEKINNRMKFFFGEPEKVNYNLEKARKFKVIKGGKSNG